MAHLFGTTFHLMYPLCNKQIINTDKILYPDTLNNSNCVFVSTPAFLSLFKKFNIKFLTPPNYIITAGSKLKNDIFAYLEKQSNIIEIYGSTETGIVAYRKKATDETLKLFPNVKIRKNKSSVSVTSPYSYENTTTISDDLTIEKRFIKFNNRTDRILKIQEKRISAEDIEQKTNKHELIGNSYCFKYKDKIAILCEFDSVILSLIGILMAVFLKSSSFKPVVSSITLPSGSL